MDNEKYLPELMAEKDSLDPSFQHSLRLLDQEIEKVQKDEDKEDEKFIDVVINKNMKLGQKVLIPVKQFPKFNFVGKLLGPRGNSLKRLQEDTLTKMSILGKGSMRDKEKVFFLCLLSVFFFAYYRSLGGVPPPQAAVPRGVAPRGAPPSRVPSSRVRGVPSQRARGAPPPPGYRPPPPVVQDTYGEYEYDDGYGTAYDDQAYDSYDNNYNNQAPNSDDYYEYSHGISGESYDSYGPEEWTNNRNKAPPARTSKGVYREQPYSRF
uniref:KH RNA binding domain containing, signal transduction associated 3 n=1 Tax=Cyprinus carpio TaxID=7962 RepID=A0A8C2D579_CYPCA